MQRGTIGIRERKREKERPNKTWPSNLQICVQRKKKIFCTEEENDFCAKGEKMFSKKKIFVLKEKVFSTKRKKDFCTVVEKIVQR